VNFGCESDEQAVLDDADDVIEFPREVHCRNGRLKGAVQNVMAAIADKRFTARISTK